MYNSSGTQIGLSAQGGTSAESIKYNTAIVGTTYFLQVFWYAGANSTSCYTFRASKGVVNFVTGANTNGIAVFKVAEEKVQFSVYPSPVVKGGNVTIQFTETFAATKQIIITNLMGRQVYKQSVNAIKGRNILNVTIPQLNSGIYFIKLNESKIKKIVVL